MGKRPVQVDGRPASSTNPATWTDFGAVAGRPHGIMLGGGLGCWDLDGVIDEHGRLAPAAGELLARVGDDALWVERSLSGRGLHVFVEAPETRAVVSQMTLYSRARFIAVTGEPYLSVLGCGSMSR